MPRRKPLSEGHVRSNANGSIRMPEKDKLANPAILSVPPTRKRLPKENQDNPVVPLKNGAGHLRIATAKFAQEEVRWLLIDHGPELLTALHALVEGRGEAVSPEQRQILRDERLLTKLGKVKPAIQAVMIAGYRETPAGPVITEPLDLSDPEHAAVSQRYDDWCADADRRSEPWTRLFLAELRGLGKAKDHDRSR